MRYAKVTWDIAAGSLLLGAMVAVAADFPPVSIWAHSLADRTWAGLPWLLLALLWAAIGIAAYRQSRSMGEEEGS